MIQKISEARSEASKFETKIMLNFNVLGAEFGEKIEEQVVRVVIDILKDLKRQLMVGTKSEIKIFRRKIG